MDTLTEFKRMNFFTGFFTTAEDWKQGQEYHLEKRKLHNRALHTPGILRVFQEPGKNLAVSAAGSLTVRVSPGAALDGMGNLIVLAQSCERALAAGASGTVYLAIKYDDQETDWEENVEDPDFSGSKRIVETPKIDFVSAPPDQTTWLELARIDLQTPVDEIKDPANPQQPQANEINCLHVRWAGSVDASRDATMEALWERARRLHEYHLNNQRRHNRGLFQAGIMRGMLKEFNVLPAGGLTVHVEPGVGLDGQGNEIFLPDVFPLTLQLPAAVAPVYIVAAYEDSFAEYLADLGKPFSASYCTAHIKTTSVKPKETEGLVLAYIDLEPDATEVRLPADPTHPQPNEIDRRPVDWAAARAVVAPKLPTPLRDRIAQIMRDKRRDFAALAKRFPTVSAADVRQTALNLETLARNDSLKAETLPEVMTMLAVLEHDVGQEIGSDFPPVVAKPEYEDYVAAVAALRNALHAGEPIDVVLNCQAAITMAARELAEVIFQAPTADAGPDQTVTSSNEETTVTLDASGSQAYDDQQIVTYRWEKEQ